jgi:hypothetical protein
MLGSLEGKTVSRDSCGCSIALKDPKKLFRPSFVVQVAEPWGGKTKRFVCSRCGDHWEWSMEKGWVAGERASPAEVRLPDLIPIPAETKR